MEKRRLKKVWVAKNIMDGIVSTYSTLKSLCDDKGLVYVTVRRGKKGRQRDKTFHAMKVGAGTYGYEIWRQEVQ